VEDLVAQRVYGLCLGYEDLNDHDQLRADPLLAVIQNPAISGIQHQQVPGSLSHKLASQLILDFALHQEFRLRLSIASYADYYALEYQFWSRPHDFSRQTSGRSGSMAGQIWNHPQFVSWMVAIIQTRMIFNDERIGRIWGGSNDCATQIFPINSLLCEHFNMRSGFKTLVLFFPHSGLQ
jgi:Transposase DDE domain group 1